MIISQYKDINIRNLDLHTPLHLAIINQHHEMVKNLLRISTFSINMKDMNHNTPLILAINLSSLCFK